MTDGSSPTNRSSLPARVRSPTTTRADRHRAERQHLDSARRGALMFDPKTRSSRSTGQDDRRGQTYGLGGRRGGQRLVDAVQTWTRRPRRRRSPGKTWGVPHVPARTAGDRAPPWRTRVFYHKSVASVLGTFARPGGRAPPLSDRQNGTTYGRELGGHEPREDRLQSRSRQLPQGARRRASLQHRRRKNHAWWTNLTLAMRSASSIRSRDSDDLQSPVVGAEPPPHRLDDARGEAWVPYREADRAARLQLRIRRRSTR